MPTQEDGQPTFGLGGLKPDELFARGMQSVKMTGAGGGNAWEPPTKDEAARLFPGYEILDIIGRGGMGAVYKAQQLALDRIVAIKLLPLEVSVDRDFAERFKREARTMAKLNHPAIVSVFDFGTTTEGHLFFVMEYVEGTTLHHIIKTTGLKPPHALEIIMGVCDALQYAHVEGVVHRDIKPANVLVDVRGRVKVTDFGLARMNTMGSAEQAGYTMTGTILGTPDYMAPEQKRGMHVDHRADIYSLGVMLYEMLCGQVPQGIFDPPSRMIAVDDRVDQVVIRAMQQEPDRRYQNTAEMHHEVHTISIMPDPHAHAPRPRITVEPPQAAPGGNHAALIATVIVAVIAIGAAIFFAQQKKTIVIVAPPAAEAAAKVEPAPTPAPVVAPVPVPPVPVIVEVKPPTPPVEARPVANPEMAAAVAQISATAPPPNGEAPIPQINPAPALEPWRHYAQQGEALMREHDPDKAADFFDQAIDTAEHSSTPVAALEIARLCYRLGSIDAGLGSTSEARGSFEHGRRLLKKGKLSPEAAQVLAELDSALRRLPRE